jgi:hypothetical protein
MSVAQLVPVAPNQVVRWGADGPPQDHKLARSIRRENGRTEARFCSDDELERRREVYGYLTADDSGDPDDCALRAVMYGPILQAIETEVAHRQRLRDRGKVPAKYPNPKSEALRSLIDEVKSRIDLADFLEAETLWQVIRRGRKESHSPCPLCATGTDRLVMWHGSPGSFWCRRCEWSGDLIDLAAAVSGIDSESADGFREVVVRLAREHLLIEGAA